MTKLSIDIAGLREHLEVYRDITAAFRTDPRYATSAELGERLHAARVALVAAMPALIERLEQAEALLRKAGYCLGNHTLSEVGDYNNNDVIAMLADIGGYFMEPDAG